MKTWQRDEDRMKAADLRLRTSTTMYGPLQLTVVNHRQGSELGYEAGIATYRENGNCTVEELMSFYLETPRYRPRTCTPKIVAEWQAMFLLGWTSQWLEDSMR
jgi:hypothetical protein